MKKRTQMKKSWLILLLIFTFLSTAIPVQAANQSGAAVVTTNMTANMTANMTTNMTANVTTNMTAKVSAAQSAETVSEVSAGISSFAAPLSLPSAYDPRTVSPPMVTPVKYQIKGTCWTYAAVASLESYVLKHTGQSKTYSENFHNYATAPDGFISGKNPYAFNRILDGSGQPYYAAYNMVTWNGPVMESQFPDAIVGRIDLSRLNIAPDVHVQGFQYFTSVSSEADRARKVNDYKAAIYQNGAVTTGSYGNDYYSPIYSRNAALYRPNAVGGTSNHAVTLVGWNDNYSPSNFAITPPGPGAFIMKNSWGTGSGDGGYFYVSYYDRFIYFNAGVSVSDVEPADNYDKIYVLSKMMGFSSKQMLNITAANTPFHIANVFTRDTADSEYLDAVGVFVQARDTDYEIYVNPEGSTLNSAALVAVASGTASTAGYITVPIDRQTLTGSKFAVAVKLKSSEARPILASDNTVSTGESYFSLTGLNGFGDHGGTGHFVINAYLNGSGAVTDPTPDPDPTPEPDPDPTPEPDPDPDPAQDNADIAAAKVVIENASFTAEQTAVTTLPQARSAAEAVIGRQNLNGVTAAVTNKTFTAAVAGTPANPGGTAGSYTFTVRLNKGIGAAVTTADLCLTIAATPYFDGAAATFPIKLKAVKTDNSLSYGTWLRTNLTTAFSPCTWNGGSTSAMPLLYTGTMSIEEPGKYYLVLAGTARWSLDGTCKAVEIEVDENGITAVQGYNIIGTSLGTTNNNGRISYHPADPATLIISWGSIPGGNIVK